MHVKLAMCMRILEKSSARYDRRFFLLCAAHAGSWTAWDPAHAGSLRAGASLADNAVPHNAVPGDSPSSSSSDQPATATDRHAARPLRRCIRKCACIPTLADQHILAISRSDQQQAPCTYSPDLQEVRYAQINLLQRLQLISSSVSYFIV
jgi:hypothetical protein